MCRAPTLRGRGRCRWVRRVAQPRSGRPLPGLRGVEHPATSGARRRSRPRSTPAGREPGRREPVSSGRRRPRPRPAPTPPGCRARPGPRRRAGARVGHPARRRAGRGQVDAAAPGAASLAARGRRRCSWCRPRSRPHQVRRRAERLGPLPDGLWCWPPPTSLRPRRQRGRRRRRRWWSSTRSRRCRDPRTVRGARERRPRCGPAPTSLVAAGQAHRRAAVVLVGHVTKDGRPGRPPRCSSTWSTRCSSFEGDRHHALRMLRAVKHRFGPTGELGLFEMGDSGLEEVADPTGCSSATGAGAPGSAVLPAVEGQRALLVEVQALVARAARRPGRAPALRPRGSTPAAWPLLLAVLEQPCRVWPCGRTDVFASAVGGMRVGRARRRPGRWPWPWPRLRRRRPCPPTWWRSARWASVGRSARCRTRRARLAEAARLGFRHARWCRASCPDGPRRMEVRQVATLAEAVELAIGASARRAASSHDPARPIASVGSCTSTARPGRGTNGRTAVRCGRGATPSWPWPRPWRWSPRDGRCVRVSSASSRPSGRAHRGRRRSRGALDLHRRLPSRRRVQPAAAVRAGQDGRRHHRVRRRQPHRPGQRPPGAEADHPDHRDRHPAPHRRAGGPLRSTCPVVSVSAAMGVITVYRNDAERHVLQADGAAARPRQPGAADPAAVPRALRRWPCGALTALEVEDTVTVRDVVAVLQPAEMSCGSPRRSRATSSSWATTAGCCGCSSTSCDRRGGAAAAPGRARLPARRVRRADGATGSRPTSGGPRRTAGGLESRPGALHGSAPRSCSTRTGGRGPRAAHRRSRCSTPRRAAGYRLLHRLPRFPEPLVDRLVDHFASCSRSCGPRSASSRRSSGVGEARARSVKEGLARLAEATILDRYN